jgi:hypothetical protein
MIQLVIYYMKDRRRPLAAMTVLMGIVVLVFVIVGVLVSNKHLVSPIPEEDAIKIIFISPTQGATIGTPSLTPTPTGSAKIQNP